MKPRISATEPLTSKEKKDLRILAMFTSLYCRDHHGTQRDSLDGLPAELHSLAKYHCCPDCRDFLQYAIERRLRCPLEDKPLCKHCEIHCYRPGHRERVRAIMRYSGRALIKKGRLDLLWHYFF